MTREDRTPTLIQNDTSSYKFVPKFLADELVKKGRAIILTPKHGEEYVRGTRLAFGNVEGFKKGEVIQIGGKAMRAEEIGIIDSDTAIKQAEKAVADAQGDDAVMAASLKDPSAFGNKVERQRPWQHGADA